MKDIRVHTIGKLNIKNVPESQLNDLLVEIYKLLAEKKKNARRVVKKEDK